MMLSYWLVQMNPTKNAETSGGGKRVCTEFPQQVHPEALCNHCDLQHDSILSEHLAK